MITRKKFSSNQIGVSAKPHSGLTQKVNSDNKRRKFKKEVGGNWMEEKKNVEVDVRNKNKGEDIEAESIDNYGCQICGKKFKRKISLKFHLIHHNPKTERDKYQCVGCNVRFKKEKDKKEHELECERNANWSQLVCCFCDLQCSSPKELRTHQRKHKPTRKNKNCKNTIICIECKEAFDTDSSLKVHMQRDHKNDIKSAEPETVLHAEDIKISIKQEDTTSNSSIYFTSNLNVSNLMNQVQSDEKSEQGELKKKATTVLVPQTPDKGNKFEEKPFMCWKCGSRYKYEKSRIKHELKYHANGETTQEKMSQNSGKVNTSQKVSNLNWTPCVSGTGKSKGEPTSRLTDVVENVVHADNNNIFPIDSMKKEIGYSLTIVDVIIDNLSVSGNSTESKTSVGKQLETRSHPNRQPIIKKRCIGCDKVFEGVKERDEHELKCGLNYSNRKFNCMFCDHPFGKPKTLRKHENKHRPVRKTKKYKNRCVCIECNRTFDAIYSLKVHMKKLHRKGNVIQFENKPFSCSICDARFKYENSKYKHEMRYHRADSEQKIKYSTGVEDKNCTLNVISHPVENSVVCKKVTDPEYTHTHWIKQEPDGKPCNENNVEYPTGNEVYNPVDNVQTEADILADASLNDASGGEVRVKTEETDESLNSSPPVEGKVGRKRKARKPVEKKTKKQKTGPYVCNNCEAKFNSPQGLWLHSYHQNMRTKRLSCIGCGKSFKSEKETEEHELKCDFNQNEYDFNCMFCDEPFETPKLLRNHETEHRPRRRTRNHKCLCISCRKPFDSIHSLKEHIRNSHKANHVKIENHEIKGKQDPFVKPRPLTVEEMMSCYVLLEDINEVKSKKGTARTKICRSNNKRIKSSDRTDEATQSNIETDMGTSVKACYAGAFTPCNVHVNIKDGIDGGNEERGIKPEFSEDLTKTPAYLVKAELTNSEDVVQERGTVPFHCRNCNAKFDSYGRLRYHSYSHRQRTKRLFCIGCGVGFEMTNDRDRHELECDVNLTDRHFSCLFCELPFDTPQSLRNHENKHRPPKRCKRYKHMCFCAECDRAFDAVFTLKIHIRHMHRRSKEKVEMEEEIEEANSNFENDLTFEEYKFDGDLKVEELL